MSSALSSLFKITLGGLALLSVSSNQAATVVSNLGEAGSASANFSSTTWLAISFTTDNQSYTLDSFVVPLDAVGGGVTVTPRIFADSGGVPSGSSLETFASQTFSSGGYKAFTSSGLSLSPSTTYWLTLEGGGAIPVWFATASTAQTGSWLIGDLGRRSSDSGSSWGTTTVNIGFVSMDATVVPEPAPLVVLALGAAGLALRRLRWRGPYNSDKL
ncbi:MAG: PEP-CTERM sorting domain-containing protein [Verrucomicrobiales bacterium]|nr:PEP-CTERM sorting domain-containing protein [Verrucomicrobiales bacterium]